MPARPSLSTVLSTVSPTVCIVSAALALTALACAPPAPSTSAAADENRRLVRELFEALNRADVAKLDALYADDFEIWTAGALPISGTRTRAQALDGMKYIDAMFPTGIRFEIVAMTVDGERVAVEAESEGVHASGKRYHNQYHFLLIVRDGQIHRFKEYMDTIHAKDVLMAPVPASVPAPVPAPAPEPQNP
jgi:ketosteroid isomerase-like protein